MNIQHLVKLIDEFDELPKIISQSTYLEICRYPRSRFEEICSRILCFFFDPTNEHGFNELFIQSLLDITSNKELCFKNNQIQVINEVNSEGKRLDILIKCPDFVIGIENKIFAQVYNPLEIYSETINMYSGAIIKVVLSVKKIVDKKEIDKITANGFKIVSYTDFFKEIKHKVGRYISHGNQKYLTYMYDFIQTIENMNGDAFENNKLSQFFSNNSEKIDDLVRLYDKYKQRTFVAQKDRIEELRQRIISQTEDNSWWAYEGWDLGNNSFNKNTNNPLIGIESSYKAQNNNPLGTFRIFITAWKIKDFKPYEFELRQRFPDNFLDKTKEDRVYLHMDVIEDDNEDLIIEKLATYYKILSELVHKHY